MPPDPNKSRAKRTNNFRAKEGNNFRATVNPKMSSDAREDHEEILRLTRGWGWRSLAAKPKNESWSVKSAKRL